MALCVYGPSGHNAQVKAAQEDGMPSAGMTGATDDRATKQVLQVGEAVGDFIEWWGFKAIHGKIWTLLAVSREARTQAELSKILEVSRALVSSAIHELESYGLVRQTGEDRQAPWEAIIDVWPTISNILRQREWMMIESVRVALESALEEVELQEEGERQFAVERLRVLLVLTELAQTFLKILVALRMPRPFAGGLGDWLKKASKFLTTMRNVR